MSVWIVTLDFWITGGGLPVRVRNPIMSMLFDHEHLAKAVEPKWRRRTRTRLSLQILLKNPLFRANTNPFHPPPPDRSKFNLTKSGNLLMLENHENRRPCPIPI